MEKQQKNMEIQHQDISCSARWLQLHSKRLIIVLFILGCIILIPSIFLMNIFNLALKKHLIIEKDSELYKQWQVPSNAVPITMAYNLFNYTNDQQVLNTGAKPRAQQIGPYVYKETRVNHVLYSDDDVIKYEQENSYVFDPQRSCAGCRENDTIVTPCVVSITLVNELQKHFENSSTFTRGLIEMALRMYSGIKLFRTMTVKQVLWGYEDPVIDMVKSVHDFLVGLGVVVPPLPVQFNGPIALQLNGTAGMLDTGNLTMLTGKRNVKDTQRIVEWKGCNTSPYWLTKYGRMINGTDGSRAPPWTSRGDVLYMFVPQLCRSLYLKYSKDVAIEGIDAYQFSTTPDLFANSSANPNNHAFCSGSPDNPECWGTGLLAMSSCREGAPIFMSAPHFYAAIPSLVDAIDGMKPNESLHRTFMDVEPMTGIVLSASKRLQINVMALKSFASKTQGFQYKHNFLPVVFVEEGGTIGASLAGRLKAEVFDRKALLSKVRVICIVVGALLIVCALGLSVRYLMKRKRYTEPVVEPSVICNEKAL